MHTIISLRRERESDMVQAFERIVLVLDGAVFLCMKCDTMVILHEYFAEEREIGCRTSYSVGRGGDDICRSCVVDSWRGDGGETTRIIKSFSLPRVRTTAQIEESDPYFAGGRKVG